MHTPILLQTKIKIPVPRSGGVRRQRLLDRLNRTTDGRLALVCAPAGFGKTTLIGQWAEQSSSKIAWYSLDETDNDLMKFWRYAIHALQAHLPPGFGERMEPLLQAYPNVAMPTILDALLQELEEREEGGLLTLVLDDYHTISAAFIHDSVGYLIDHLPEGVRLVIASRSELPLSTTSKWRVRGKLIDIGSRQLEFTEEETRRFCQDTSGLRLSDERIQLLQKWTEGWAASLQLLVLTLKEHEDPDRFFLQYSGSDRGLIQYLLEEVLGQLPADIRRFLLRTSILSRFDAECCEAVTLGNDSRAMLDRLQRLNLFLVPLDDTQGWYRYHHLFSMFLKTQLLKEDPELAVALHRLAADHLAGRSLLEEALEHSLEAGDIGTAIGLLGAQISSVIERGEWSTLLRWMNRLPTEALPFQIRLLYAFTLIVTGQFESAAEELRRLERFAADAEPGEERQEMRSSLFFAKINLAFSSGDYEQWYSYADRIPDMLPESPLLYRFNYNTNEPFVRRTAFGLRGMQTPETEAIAGRIIGILDSHGWGQSLFTQYIVQSLAEGYYEWDRLGDSRRLLRRIEPIARKHRIAGLLVPNLVAAARLQWAEGSEKEAHRTIEDTIELVRDELREPRWLAPLHAFQAGLHLRAGNTALAETLLSSLKLAAPNKPSLMKNLEYLTYARLLGAKRKEKDALGLLETLNRLNRREGCIVGIVDAEALQALLNAQRGYRSEAFAHLGEALALGEANGYIRAFVDEGEPMRSLLMQFKEQRNREEHRGISEEYLERLIGRFPLKEAPMPSERLIEPLSPKESAVLLEAVRGAANREIADRLHLTEGTVKVYLSRIYGKLGVSSRIQALRRAEELQLFE
ncbi:LuxR C-terminal-related transcriptional regulator [Cohnella sp. AR92]|uniref:LuxR C-terminal-related transcriptional regulator n=1 Tax=Cohnella sp. AR92 TaxID=648716 RepID=UPI000F8CEBDE|nr:LuxR C-terminal-related transcriptional regulator [Cohnella sp. AR92]RUS46639.1 transcriptional regulator [Cohnella sp. AR92]